MKRLCFVVLLVGLMASGAFATTNNWVGSAGPDPPAGTGEWSASAAYWSGGIPVDTGLTADYVKIQTTTDCTLNSGAGNFANNKVTIAGTTATLEIIGGSIGIGNEMQVSDAAKTGYVIQTGGTVSTFQGSTAGKIEVGYKTGVGYYTISGGAIGFSGSSNVGQIIVGGAGSAGATGTFTVKGNLATINTDKLWVGTKDAAAGYPGTGTLAFQLDGSVSPIKVATSVTLDNAGAASIANLVVGLLDADVPPSSILLVENTGASAVSGTFDSLNGGSAAEGAPVTLSYGGNNYNYTLTYKGGVGGNDIMLIPEPATLALLGLGSLIAIRRRRS